MLRLRIRRLIAKAGVIGAAGLAAAITTCPPALAGDSGGIGASCSNDPASCTVSASDPAAPATGGTGPSAPVTGSGSAPGDTAQPVCTSQPFTPSAADLVTLDQQYPPGTGHWEVITCAGPNLPTRQVLHWVANGAPALPDPEVLAAQAEAKLILPYPSIQASPAVGLPQVVQLPTWTWLPQAQWTALSATASVPGESVTATATPSSVAWMWGDGTSSVCQGPGTAFTTGVNDPSTSSPTCGHTYQVTSAQAPDQQFTVTATVWWAVTWSGAGASGTFPDLTTSSTVHWTVSQIQSIQINPGS
jgi:hypothetical protein